MRGADGDDRVPDVHLLIVCDHFTLDTGIIHLRQDDDDRHMLLSALSQEVDDVRVVECGLFTRVNGEEDHVSMFECKGRLPLYVRLEIFVFRRAEAARVEEDIWDLAIDAISDEIARGAGDLALDRAPRPHEPVEESGFSGIRTANDGNSREFGHGKRGAQWEGSATVAENSSQA